MFSIPAQWVLKLVLTISCHPQFSGTHHNVECFLQYSILEGINLPVQERGWILCGEKKKKKIVVK